MVSPRTGRTGQPVPAAADVFDDVLSRLVAAIEAAIAGIAAQPTGEQAYRAATQVGAHLAAATENVAAARARAAARTADELSLSLRGLATRFGVSHARTAQMLAQGRAPAPAGTLGNGSSGPGRGGSDGDG